MRIAILFGLVIFFATSCQEQATENVTPSGYKYTIHETKGGATPNVTDWVYFHAQIRNGEEVLYTSRDQGSRPKLQINEAGAGRKPSPVEEILQLLGEGDSATVEIRLDTIENKPQGFENAEVMYYDVVALEIKSEATLGAEKQAIIAREAEVAALVSDLTTKYANGELTDQFQTTETGLKYIIHEEGTGPMPETGKAVVVHYYGALTDGNMFDNSFRRGEPFAFPLGAGQVIKGWDEGIALLPQGTKATLFIPYELGYGETGSPPNIPAQAELVFYVETL